MVPGHRRNHIADRSVEHLWFGGSPTTSVLRRAAPLHFPRGPWQVSPWFAPDARRCAQRVGPLAQNITSTVRRFMTCQKLLPNPKLSQQREGNDQRPDHGREEQQPEYCRPSTS